MTHIFDFMMNLFGLTNENSSVAIFLKVSLALLLAYIVLVVINTLIRQIIKRIFRRYSNEWIDVLVDVKFFTKILRVIPLFLLDIWSSEIVWQGRVYMDSAVDIGIVVVFTMAVMAFLNGFSQIYSRYEMSKNRPITSFVQVLKICVYIIVAIVIASIIIHQNPVHLLYGLGAFTAVLMLIFKDTILGFISGIQLASNNMLAIGDWIELKNGDANGEVLEINLYTVKVQNWDKTITTIPTYQLASQPFVNWRGMQESGGRRIKRSVLIDFTSIRFLESSELEALKKLPTIGKLTSQLLEENAHESPDGCKTNLWLLRKYLSSWVDANPALNHQMTAMVRQLQPTPNGVPVEIYCFTKTKAWKEYESVQSDIFDHFFAVAPLFSVKIFQYGDN